MSPQPPAESYFRDIIGVMSEVTNILSQIRAGDPSHAEQLLPLVYQELRRLAASKLASEKPGQTLQPTALVHEAFLRLVGPNQSQCWDSRGHFFAAAAQAMRRILVEQARRKKRLRHGGDMKRQAMPDIESPARDDELLALDEALSRLRTEDSLAGTVVDLRYFAGLTHEQIAEILGISLYQARQKWTYARAWLKAALRD